MLDEAIKGVLTAQRHELNSLSNSACSAVLAASGLSDESLQPQNVSATQKHKWAATRIPLYLTYALTTINHRAPFLGGVQGT
jgi:hypothetical protein